MALLKGKGSMTGVNLIAKVYDNAKTNDGKSHYADLQIDARDPRGPQQANLHLKSEKAMGPDGRQHYNNGAPYSVGQMAEIIKAAGPNTEPLLNRDGTQVGTLYGFKGNVMPASRGTGLVVNTKTVEPSEFKVDANTLDNQFASMRAARQELEAAKAAAEAPVVEPALETTQLAAVEEPAVG